MAEIQPLEVVVYEGNVGPDLQIVGGEDESIPLAANGSTDAAQEDNVDLQGVDAEDEFSVEETGAGSDDPATGKFMEPMKGMIFDSENDAIAFSQRYARYKGFTITRRTSKTVDDKLQYFTLACNRQGKAQCSSSSRNISKHNPSTRTQCPAKLNFRLHGPNKFCLTSHILEHNHDLSPSETGVNVCRNKTHGVSAKRRRQESTRGRSEVCANKMAIFTHAQGGDFENHQFGENECADNSKEETRLKFSFEDTHVLYRYFFRMQSKNPNFFYAMDFDENSRLRNVFWADARSRAAYESFSDVVKFDTAYLTNKYEVPLACFVGVNHHGEPILLGCGLLSNQNTESFVWLFKSWLACMSYKPPKGMITDQCDEMQDAVEQVFPQTYHSWCLSSVIRKIPEKLHGLSKLKEITFTFSNVINESLTKGEFEKGWIEMISDFSLQRNEWLIKLCINWQKWAPAYIKDTFWAGMPVTEECESEYALFDGYVSSGTTINQFLEQYSKALRDMVEKETDADFKSSQEVASCITHYDIEKQFQLAYTNKKFEEFQEQLKGKIYCYPKLLKQEGTSYTFNVAEDVKIREQQLTSDFSVWFNEDGYDVRCVCRHFEFRGILCCHIISVLTLMKIKEVPSKYVLQRWRKDLERSHTSIACSYDFNVNAPIAWRFDELCLSFYDVAEKAATSDALFELVMDGLGQLKVKVEAQHAILNKTQSGDASSKRQGMEPSIFLGLESRFHGKVTMRPLGYVTLLAIFLSTHLHLCASSRLLAERPAAAPNGQRLLAGRPAAAPNGHGAAGAPAPVPAAGSPENIRANHPVSTPANKPANVGNLPVPPEVLAKLPVNVPPDLLANIPPETLANIEASQGQLQTSEILAIIPALQGQLPANLPPEVLAKLPELQRHLPANITPEMLASLAAVQQTAGQPGAAAALRADIPEIPKMPDFSGLANISFPPMPSGPKMPKLPSNFSLFGYEVPIPKFISRMVDGNGDGGGGGQN